jgi:hypothetical protein
LDHDLDRIGENTLPSINRWATLPVVQQAPRGREDFDAPTSEDFWTRAVPITQDVIDSWVIKAEYLKSVRVAHDAPRLFGEIEEPLEALEEPVGRFIDDIERIERQRFDEMLGK